MNTLPIAGIVGVGAIHATHAEISDNVTFDEWLEFGRQCVRAAESLQWAIGDWINFGEDKFAGAAPGNGSADGLIHQTRYDLAVRNLPLEYGTLRNIASVCRRVPLSFRNDKLLFSHHVVVASLEPAKQKKYLGMAAAKSPRMPVAELRQLVRENEATCDEGTDDVSAPQENVMKHVYTLSIWAKRQDVSSWPKKRREAVKADLAPVVDLYNRL